MQYSQIKEVTFYSENHNTNGHIILVWDISCVFFTNKFRQIYLFRYLSLARCTELKIVKKEGSMKEGSMKEGSMKEGSIAIIELERTHKSLLHLLCFASQLHSIACLLLPWWDCISPAPKSPPPSAASYVTRGSM